MSRGVQLASKALVAGSLDMLGAMAGIPGAASLVAGLSAVLEDSVARSMSTRQEERLAAVAQAAVREIQDRLQQGQTPRADGFFTNHDVRVADGDALFEEVLRAAQDAAEQRKLPHFARFYTSAVFDASLTLPEARFLLTLGQSLDIAQWQIIEIFRQPHQWPLRGRDIRKTGREGHEQRALLHLALDLHQRKLVTLQVQGDDSVVVEEIWGVLPGTPGVTDLGQRFADHFHLADLDRADCAKIAEAL